MQGYISLTSSRVTTYIEAFGSSCWQMNNHQIMLMKSKDFYWKFVDRIFCSFLISSSNDHLKYNCRFLFTHSDKCEADQDI